MHHRRNRRTMRVAAVLGVLAAAGAACAHANVRLQNRAVPEFAPPPGATYDFGTTAEAGADAAQATQQVLSAATEAAGACYSDESSATVANVCPPSGVRKRKIAIVGAGPSGSSAAFFLGRAQEKLRRDKSWRAGSSDCEEELDIVVFEREERVGGRTTVVHPYDDAERYPAVELGASIYADVNRNLVRAAKCFGLPTGAKLGEEDGTTSVWDGQQFVFENLGGGWWNDAKMLWRYGYAPMTTKTFVQGLTDQFLRLYDPAWLHGSSGRGEADAKAAASKIKGWPWCSIEDLADALGFSELAARTTLDHFYHEAGIQKLFVEEVVEAATRVNYGQNTDELHALGGGVSLAATGATGVQGGNFQIFERMLGDSGAKLRMGGHGRVTGIIKYENVEDYLARAASPDAAVVAEWPRGSTKYYVGTLTNFGELYDAVFIAAPWHSAGITLLDAQVHFPDVEYVRLHVTLAVTNASSPSPAYFGRGADEVMPKTVLTTNVSVRKDERKRGAGAGTKKHPKLEFNSLNYIRNLGPRKEADGVAAGLDEHLIKIFSQDEISDDKLAELFGPGTVSWVLRKQWDAYPKLRPTRTFPPLVADERLYYINALEPLISTMETSTISARNAVALLLQEWYGDEFIHGGEGCSGLKSSAHERAAQLDKLNVTAAADDDWAGWGCRSA